VTFQSPAPAHCGQQVLEHVLTRPRKCDWGIRASGARQNIWRGWNSQLESFHFWNCPLHKAISHSRWEEAGGAEGKK